jgi:hypothetical protein
LGERDGAIEWLDKAYHARAGALVYIGSDPSLESKRAVRTVLPTCDPGDLCIALRAESTLFRPEITKSAGTPKRFQHVSPFAFFEVGFIGWIVRVSFAFDLDVSFDGSALGVV